MSNASALVKFPDGTIKHGIYHGTGDVMYAALFDSNEEAWEHNRTPRMDEHGPELEEFPVVIYQDYGRGMWWEGVATKTHIISGLSMPEEWYDDDDEYDRHQGQPEWVKEYWG